LVTRAVIAIAAGSGSDTSKVESTELAAARKAFQLFMFTFVINSQLELPGPKFGPAKRSTYELKVRGK